MRLVQVLLTLGFVSACSDLGEVSDKRSGEANRGADAQHLLESPLMPIEGSEDPGSMTSYTCQSTWADTSSSATMDTSSMTSTDTSATVATTSTASSMTVSTATSGGVSFGLQGAAPRGLCTCDTVEDAAGNARVFGNENGLGLLTSPPSLKRLTLTVTINGIAVDVNASNQPDRLTIPQLLTEATCGNQAALDRYARAVAANGQRNLQGIRPTLFDVRTYDDAAIAAVRDRPEYSFGPRNRGLTQPALRYYQLRNGALLTKVPAVFRNCSWVSSCR